MTDYTYPGGQNTDGINVSHINYLYDRSVDNIKHMVEIAKLQYDASVTDIDHDYAVVDVFTDTTGYNNTVCTADTTSTFTSTGLAGHYAGCDAVVTSVEVRYDREIASVYLTGEVEGTGTVVYNIINATTSCCIATAVPLNCFYYLNACVCCHIYEIVQCSDGVSCIKSYALIAGEA